MSQIVNINGLSGQNLGMAKYDRDEVHKKFMKFVSRKGHGSIAKIARRSGLNRVTVSRFQSNPKVGPKTLRAISDAVDAELRSPKKAQDVSAHVNFDVIGRDLVALGELLQDDTLDDEGKTMRLTTAIDLYSEALDRALLSANEPN